MYGHEKSIAPIENNRGLTAGDEGVENPSAEGTGIDLVLAKRIIEVHGGRIWIESEGDGNGAAFCFTLPNSNIPGS